MWQKILYLILRLFRWIENPVKQREDDAATLPEKEAVKYLPEWISAPPPLPPPPVEVEPASPRLDSGWESAPTPPSLPKPKPPVVKPPDKWKLRWEIINEIIDRPFDSQLATLPTRRYSRRTKLANGGEKVELGVYDVYGRAPKESGNKKFKKAQLKVFEDLPGKWNKGKPRLYMEIHVGEHFREGLARAGELEERITALLGEQYDVLSYPYSIGAYSHRHIQHNPEKALSYHSWAIAFDQNPGWNRGINYAATWIKPVKKNGKVVWVPATPVTAKKGPVNTVLPFSKQYYEIFPKSVPFEFVLAMKSVGFSWGGDWGRSAWHEVVRKFGVGYDMEDPKVKNDRVFLEAMNEWESMRYFDGMHFEATTRGAWAKKLWAQHQTALEDNILVA